MNPLENASDAVDNDPTRLADQQRRSSEDWRACQRLWRAIMLAPDLETLDALLAGEAVPLQRLDPTWVNRFGIRQNGAE